MEGLNVDVHPEPADTGWDVKVSLSRGRKKKAFSVFFGREDILQYGGGTIAGMIELMYRFLIVEKKESFSALSSINRSSILFERYPELLGVEQVKPKLGGIGQRRVERVDSVEVIHVSRGNKQDKPPEEMEKTSKDNFMEIMTTSMYLQPWDGVEEGNVATEDDSDTSEGTDQDECAKKQEKAPKEKVAGPNRKPSAKVKGEKGKAGAPEKSNGTGNQKPKKSKIATRKNMENKRYKLRLGDDIVVTVDPLNSEESKKKKKKNNNNKKKKNSKSTIKGQQVDRISKKKMPGAKNKKQAASVAFGTSTLPARRTTQVSKSPRRKKNPSSKHKKGSTRVKRDSKRRRRKTTTKTIHPREKGSKVSRGRFLSPRDRGTSSKTDDT